MHYYPFDIALYMSHTRHLTDIEDLAYRRALDWYYLNEKPLPENIETIAKLLNMRMHCECIANVMREFFILVEGEGYRQIRADSEISVFHEKSEKAKKSALTRWKKHNKIKMVHTKLTVNANALPTQSERNANQELELKSELNNKSAIAPIVKKQTDLSSVKIPEWLNPKAWQAFVEHRKHIKKPLTENSAKLAIGKLDEIRLAGGSPVASIKNSIFCGWAGLFMPKDDIASQKTFAEKTQDYKDEQARKFYKPLLEADQETLKKWGLA